MFHPSMHLKLRSRADPNSANGNCTDWPLPVKLAGHPCSTAEAAELRGRARAGENAVRIRLANAPPPQTMQAASGSTR
jgi:hypothetical protein